ncbi:ABC-three component system middle component 6 [Mesorhizobium sp. Mes31]|uniref:ABC-three component system middle component 6 n=1 Tax=Mesorhizobium sp. Mes31 TaxID=2926017 RepID=UPI002810FDF0|nr:ABC-three component system middle component 6 [Mesorhizobium sp. Mes31]
MILPGKHLQYERALLGVGAEILSQLTDDCTVSEIWERVRYARGPAAASLSFDWFILALTFLYTVAAIEFAEGAIRASSPS